MKYIGTVESLIQFECNGIIIGFWKELFTGEQKPPNMLKALKDEKIILLDEKEVNEMLEKAKEKYPELCL